MFTTSLVLAGNTETSSDVITRTASLAAAKTAATHSASFGGNVVAVIRDESGKVVLRGVRSVRMNRHAGGFDFGRAKWKEEL